MRARLDKRFIGEVRWTSGSPSLTGLVVTVDALEPSAAAIRQKWPTHKSSPANSCLRATIHPSGYHRSAPQKRSRHVVILVALPGLISLMPRKRRSRASRIQTS
jgi:hypothetical protein